MTNILFAFYTCTYTYVSHGQIQPANNSNNKNANVSNFTFAFI